MSTTAHIELYFRQLGPQTWTVEGPEGMEARGRTPALAVEAMSERIGSYAVASAYTTPPPLED